jgi:hypothetical protein
VWYDGQAGQLRSGVTSRSPADLPFSGDWLPTADLALIIASCLEDQSPGVVGWDELRRCDFDAPAPPDRPPLHVWTYELVSQT